MIYSALSNLQWIAAEVESFDRHPARIIQIRERREQSSKIVIAHTRFAAICFVDMYMLNIRRILSQDLGVQILFIYRIMRVEHGLNRGTSYLLHNGHSLGHTIYHVRLACGQSLDKYLDAATLCMGSGVRQLMR